MELPQILTDSPVSARSAFKSSFSAPMMIRLYSDRGRGPEETGDKRRCSIQALHVQQQDLTRQNRQDAACRLYTYNNRTWRDRIDQMQHADFTRTTTGPEETDDERRYRIHTLNAQQQDLMRQSRLDTACRLYTNGNRT